MSCPWCSTDRFPFGVRWSFVLILGSMVSAFLIGSPLVAADSWQVGAAARIITPQEPMWMAGYGSRNAPSSGKLSELYAKALLLKPETGDAALVLSLDLVGIDRSLSQKVRQAIGKELDIQPDNVLIATSHTHSGPVVGKNLATLHYYQVDKNFQKQIDQYESLLLEHCIAVAKSANQSLQPCQLSWGHSSTDFATNRRANKEPEVPALRAVDKLQGPVDHDVPVLAARNTDGKLVAILFGYACHSTVLSDYVWSADYPGYAQSYLEAQHPGAVALFWAGCGADQNPLPRRTPELAHHYGQRLGVAVQRVLLTTQMELLPSQLSCKYAEVEAPLDTLPTKEELEAQVKSSNKYEAVRARLELEQDRSRRTASSDVSVSHKRLEHWEQDHVCGSGR